eukprot:scaffold398_cov206-Pinguiococcus_pyrenoidosus.AAC.8
MTTLNYDYLTIFLARPRQTDGNNQNGGQLLAATSGHPASASREKHCVVSWLRWHFAQAKKLVTQDSGLRGGGGPGRPQQTTLWDPVSSY